SQSRLLSHIGEAQFARRDQFIAKQPGAGLPVFRGREFGIARLLFFVEHRALNQKNVQIAVVVVIEQGRARAHNFRQIKFSGRACEVLEDEARLRGRFSEERGLRGSKRRKKRRQKKQSQKKKRRTKRS